ncbi:hypothetical protein SAMN05444380_103182 [Thermophagus xiamenensis]|uniref:Uncharacterized protein n=1 Tax=Thermophagus xiamenensis TaxID=385682 RepID=A0A1I1W1K4_9BACT|nr:hypothetical protein SAMN05444380_103182 [Thermophagus xiamenensis]
MMSAINSLGEERNGYVLVYVKYVREAQTKIPGIIE